MTALDFCAAVRNARPLRRRSGRQEYVADCPLCRAPALRFRDCKNGMGLVCDAGCNADALLAAIGLTFADLAEPRPPATPGPDAATPPVGVMTAAEFCAHAWNARVVGRRRGRLQYTADCPLCHRHALSFSDCKRGLGFMCYAGCDGRALLAAANLTLKDLFPDLGTTPTGTELARQPVAEHQ
jgi:hypothetical protein